MKEHLNKPQCIEKCKASFDVIKTSLDDVYNPLAHPDIQKELIEQAKRASKCIVDHYQNELKQHINETTQGVLESFDLNTPARKRMRDRYDDIKKGTKIPRIMTPLQAGPFFTPDVKSHSAKKAPASDDHAHFPLPTSPPPHSKIGTGSSNSKINSTAKKSSTTKKSSTKPLSMTRLAPGAASLQKFKNSAKKKKAIQPKELFGNDFSTKPTTTPVTSTPSQSGEGTMGSPASHEQSNTKKASSPLDQSTNNDNDKDSEV